MLEKKGGGWETNEKGRKLLLTTVRRRHRRKTKGGSRIETTLKNVRTARDLRAHQVHVFHYVDGRKVRLRMIKDLCKVMRNH